jgi:voltage-gated potassium channel
MNTRHPDLKAYEFVILGLSLYALAALAVEAVVHLDPDTRRVLGWVDTAICGVFLFDFVFNLVKAENRWHYFVTWGWIDLVSSVPTINVFGWISYLRLGRVARVFRILRVLRGLRATKVIAFLILDRRAESAFLAVCLVSVLATVSAAIGIMHIERPPLGNINGPGDALWWAMATITTVAYGDRYPVTPEGRMLAGLLMIAGIGLLGALSGLITTWLLGPTNRRQEIELTKLRHEIEALRRAVESR